MPLLLIGPIRVARLLADDAAGVFDASGSFALWFAVVYDLGVSGRPLHLVVPALLCLTAGGLGIGFAVGADLLLVWRQRYPGIHDLGLRRMRGRHG